MAASSNGRGRNQKLIDARKRLTSASGDPMTPQDVAEAMNAFLDSADDALKKTLVDAEGQFRVGFGTQSSGFVDRLEFPGVADVRRYLAEDPKPRVPMMMIVTAVHAAGLLPWLCPPCRCGWWCCCAMSLISFPVPPPLWPAGPGAVRRG